MREIKSGDIILRIRGTSMIIYYYRKEFNKDLIKEVINVQNKQKESAVEVLQILEDMNIDTNRLIENSLDNKKYLEDKLKEDISVLTKHAHVIEKLKEGAETPIFETLEFAWVMNKAQLIAEEKANEIRPFEQWLAQYQDIKILDIQKDVMEELQAGIFRKTK